MGLGPHIAVMSAIKRHGTPVLLVVRPDGSRSLIPASWTDWAGTVDDRHRRLNIAIPPRIADGFAPRKRDRGRSSWSLPDSTANAGSR
jgi:hypothetical protein